NTVVVFPKAGFPSVKKDDQISVVGTVDGVFAGRTDAGQTLNLPRVLATRIEILPRAGASPAGSASASAAASSSAAAKPSASASASASASSSASPSASAQGNVRAGTYRVTGAGANGLSVRTSAGITATNKIGVVHDNELVTVTREAAPG